MREGDMTLKTFITTVLKDLEEFDLVESPISFEVHVIPDGSNVILSTFEGEPASTIRFAIMPVLEESNHE